ncbi:MAG: hypothetical protein ACRDTZ_00965 [Pseudonocardiaceae bacterium]
MTDTRGRAFRATGPTLSRAAAAATPMTARGEILRQGPVGRGGEKIDDDDNDEKKGKTVYEAKDDKDDDKPKDDMKVEKAKDDEDDDEKPKDEKGGSVYIPDVKKAASAGTAGDFESVKGDPSGSDNNADKGNQSAPNDTGVPQTPSGASV